MDLLEDKQCSSAGGFDVSHFIPSPHFVFGHFILCFGSFPLAFGVFMVCTSAFRLWQVQWSKTVENDMKKAKYKLTDDLDEVLKRRTRLYIVSRGDRFVSRGDT